MVFDPRLGARFMFDADDLAANGRGELSAEQERMFSTTVRVMRTRERRVGWSLVVVFSIVIAGVVLAVVTTPGGSLAGGLVAGGALAWILGIIAFFRRRGRRMTQALDERRMLTAEGPLNVRTSATGTWYAHVGAARVGIDRYQSEVLEEDGLYRVHYLDAPDGSIPLSIERM